MSRHRVSIRANRGTAYANKQFAREVEAEISSSSVLEASDFVKGRMLDLTPSQLRFLSRLREVSLHIEGRYYRVVSLDANGDFLALKDTSA